MTASTVRSLGKAIVAISAPDEAEIYDALADRYFASGTSPHAWLETADEELGSGLEMATVLVTYLVLPVLVAVFKPTAEELGLVLRDVSRETLKRLLRPHAKALQEEHARRVRELPPAVRDLPETQAKLKTLAALYEDTPASPTAQPDSRD